MQERDIVFGYRVGLQDEADGEYIPLFLVPALVCADLDDVGHLGGKPQPVEDGVTGQISDKFPVLFQQILHQLFLSGFQRAEHALFRLVEPSFGYFSQVAFTRQPVQHFNDAFARFGRQV